MRPIRSGVGFCQGVDPGRFPDSDRKRRSWDLVRTFAAIAAAAVGGACASGPPNTIAEGYEGAPGVRHVLLAPPNLVVALPAEIQSGAAAVDREIGSYLESQGREVERFGLLEGRRLWKQAVAEAKAGGSSAGAVGIFVRELSNGHAFDALAVPALLLHETRAEMGNASWDGVSRRMRIAHGPAATVGRDQSTLTKGLAFGGISGPVWVTSVHVLVFSLEGERVFEGRGGIDFVHEADLVDEGRNYRYELRPNTALFSDRERLHEAVVRAFKPYLRPPTGR